MEPVVDWRGDGRGERRSYWMSRYHSPTQHRCWNTSCFDLFIYIYIFFMSSVATLLDNQSGLLSMPG